VHVLRTMIEAVRPGGTVLDLQVIRPNPRAEILRDGSVVCELDGGPLFAKADAAAAAVDAAIADGRLIEEAVDDHDVLKHFPYGADLVDDYARLGRVPLGDGEARLRAIEEPCATRERCRLRVLVRER
jgi:hypothetical protein